MSEKHIGTVVQVIGPVLDIRFRMTSCPSCSTPSRSTTTARNWWWKWPS